MTSNNNNTPDQLEAMLKLTAQRLGTTPEALKAAAQNGDLSRVLGQNTAETSALQKVLSDPEAAQKLLSTPQAQKLMQLFNRQGK